MVGWLGSSPNQPWMRGLPLVSRISALPPCRSKRAWAAWATRRTSPWWAGSALMEGISTRFLSSASKVARFSFANWPRASRVSRDGFMAAPGKGDHDPTARSVVHKRIYGSYIGSAGVGPRHPQPRPLRQAQGQVQVLYGLGGHALAQVVESHHHCAVAVPGDDADIGEGAARGGGHPGRSVHQAHEEPTLVEGFEVRPEGTQLNSRRKRELSRGEDAPHHGCTLGHEAQWHLPAFRGERAQNLGLVLVVQHLVGAKVIGTGGMMRGVRGQCAGPRGTRGGGDRHEGRFPYGERQQGQLQGCGEAAG